MAENDTADKELNCVRLKCQRNYRGNIPFECSTNFDLVSAEKVRGLVHVVPYALLGTKVNLNSFKQVSAQSELESKQPWDAEQVYAKRSYEFIRSLIHMKNSATPAFASM